MISNFSYIFPVFSFLFFTAELSYGDALEFPSDIKFGNVLTGQVCASLIKIKNTSNKEIEIRELKPSCSCVKLFAGEIKVLPLQSIPITIITKGHSKSKNSKEKIGIEWAFKDNTCNYISVIPIEFETISPIFQNIEIADFGKVNDCDDKKIIVKVSHSASEANWDDLIVVSDQYFNTNVTKIENDIWEIEVSIKKLPFPQGKVCSGLPVLFFKSGEKESYNYSLSVCATIERSIAIDKTSFLFSNSNKHAEFTIFGNDLKKLNVTTDSEKIVLDKMKYENKMLKIKFHVEMQEIPLIGNIFINSNDMIRAVKIPVVSI